MKELLYPRSNKWFLKLHCTVFLSSSLEHFDRLRANSFFMIIIINVIFDGQIVLFLNNNNNNYKSGYFTIK